MVVADGEALGGGRLVWGMDLLGGPRVLRFPSPRR